MNKIEDENKEFQKVEEAFFRYIGYQHIQNTSQDVENSKLELGEVEYPKELDDWFYDYLNQLEKVDKRRNRHKKFKSISSKIAVFIIIISITFITLMVSVEAIRVKVLNFMIDVKEQYTSIQVIEKNNLDSTLETVIPQDWINYYLPTYIPSLFEIDKVESFGNTKIIYYKDNNDNEIQFSWSPNNSSFQIDTEGANSNNIAINGTEGIIITKDKLTTILWFDQENTFYILGKVDKLELIKMAESIKKK